MTIQSTAVIQKQAAGGTKTILQNTAKECVAGVATKEELELLNSGSDSTYDSNSSAELLNVDGSPRSSPGVQPKWYKILDKPLRNELRQLCKEVGIPPFNPEAMSKLQNRFDINVDEATKIVGLFNEGKLQHRPKSILKSGNSHPSFKKSLSWSDHKGGDLTLKHEMDSWHYMDAKKFSPTQCCLLL